MSKQKMYFLLFMLCRAGGEKCLRKAYWRKRILIKGFYYILMRDLATSFFCD